MTMILAMILISLRETITELSRQYLSPTNLPKVFSRPFEHQDSFFVRMPDALQRPYLMISMAVISAAYLCHISLVGL